MNLTKAQRAVLFAMFEGNCAYCGCVLPERGWHADHIEAIERTGHYERVEGKPYTHKYVQDGKCLRPENDHCENYYPSCRACNINKSCTPLEVWRRQLEGLAAAIRRDHAMFRHAERFGLVVVVETKVVFYFEKFSPQAEQQGNDGK